MNRRKSLFVKHPVQSTYLKVVLLAMVIPMLVSTACLYYLIWQTVANELALPELIAQSLFPALKQVNQVILIVLPVVCAIIFFIAVRVSNRLAGPIYRIEKDLDDMIHKKNFHKQIRIRPHDQIPSLVSKINTAIQAASRQHKPQ